MIRDLIEEIEQVYDGEFPSEKWVEELEKLGHRAKDVKGGWRVRETGTTNSVFIRRDSPRVEFMLDGELFVVEGSESDNFEDLVVKVQYMQQERREQPNKARPRRP